MAIATESGHWYTVDGQPAYTIKGRNGEDRPTTLRDARKFNLLPSVTTIIRCAAAPGLERWKRQQVLMAALTLPRNDGEPEAEWLARVEQDWQEQGRAAADRGTEIHAAIEQAYTGSAPPWDLVDYVEAATSCVTAHCAMQEWSPESSFAALGYGGKVDLHSDGWVIDFKTKDGELKPDIWDEHAMQLAAYRRGLDKPNARCAIVFVRRDQPEALFVEVPEDRLKAGLVCFDALLMFWQAKNNYWPSVRQAA